MYMFVEYHYHHNFRMIFLTNSVSLIICIRIFLCLSVERGLMELKRLGLETQLWEASRKMIDPDSANNAQLDIDF